MRTIRIVLGIILAIVSLNALGGGYYGMAGAENVPVEWLNGSPFRSYFVPSLFLFIVVGGTCLIATLALFRNSRHAKQYALYSSILLLSWICVQILMIGYVSWMQPVTFMTGIVVLILTGFLPQGHHSHVKP